MPNIVPPSADRPIINQDGAMSDAFRAWTQAVTTIEVIVGAGTPENVVPAGQGRLYINTSGISGMILYVKRDAAIANDPKRGWVMA